MNSKNENVTENNNPDISIKKNIFSLDYSTYHINYIADPIFNLYGNLYKLHTSITGEKKSNIVVS